MTTRGGHRALRPCTCRRGHSLAARGRAREGAGRGKRAKAACTPATPLPPPGTPPVASPIEAQRSRYVALPYAWSCTAPSTPHHRKHRHRKHSRELTAQEQVAGEGGGGARKCGGPRLGRVGGHAERSRTPCNALRSSIIVWWCGAAAPPRGGSAVPHLQVLPQARQEGVGVIVAVHRWEEAQRGAAGAGGGAGFRGKGQGGGHVSAGAGGTTCMYIYVQERENAHPCMQAMARQLHGARLPARSCGKVPAGRRASQNSIQL